MFGIKKKEVKEEELMQQNRFKSIRRYRIKEGFVDEIVKRLQEVYEYLRIDPDNSGFTPATSADISKETGMGGAFIGTMIEEKLITRAPNRGEGPKFKYKWNSIVPTREMAINLIKTNYNRLHPDDPNEDVEIGSMGGMYDSKNADRVDSKGEVEINTEERIATDDGQIKVRVKEPEKKRTVLIDYDVEDSIMTVNINLDAFGITEQEIINGLMTMLALKSKG